MNDQNGSSDGNRMKGYDYDGENGNLPTKKNIVYKINRDLDILRD